MEVPASPLGKSDIDRYTGGDCYVLAGAIEESTGWPVFTLTNHCGQPSHHAFALVPGDQAALYGFAKPTALDAQGLHTVQSLVQQYAAQGYAPAPKEFDFVGIWGMHEYSEDCLPEEIWEDAWAAADDLLRTFFPNKVQ